MGQVTNEVIIRMRMSSHDAHYAGDLVDGAKMLQLFGDVATELLIRHDGDEGLFKAYDMIEFLECSVVIFSRYSVIFQCRRFDPVSGSCGISGAAA